jgi:two-component system sensor histidine kinase HydH
VRINLLGRIQQPLLFAAAALVTIGLLFTGLMGFNNARHAVEESRLKSAEVAVYSAARALRIQGPSSREEAGQLFQRQIIGDLRSIAMLDHQGKLIAGSSFAPGLDQDRELVKMILKDGRLKLAIHKLKQQRYCFFYQELDHEACPSDCPQCHTPGCKCQPRCPHHHWGNGEQRCPHWQSHWQKLSGGQRVVLRVGFICSTTPVRNAIIHLILISVMIALAWCLVVLQERLRRRLQAKEAENRLVEKLAALGEMSAVLAHEIRNPLGGLKGHAQLVLEGMSAQHPDYAALTTVVQEAVRLEKLVNQLLTFARPPSPNKEVLLVDQQIYQAVTMLQTSSIPIEVDVPKSIAVMADAGHFQQILLNLLKNAQECSPPDAAVKLTANTRDFVAEIRVMDRGIGLREEDRENVFRPFFTTRTRGTGLGLAICRELAQANGGSIQVEYSAANEGTSFMLTLPLATEHN